MKFERVKEYLKNKINNSWYVNAKEDYNIDGHFINCELLDENEHISECNSIIDEIIEFLKEQRKEVKL